MTLSSRRHAVEGRPQQNSRKRNRSASVQPSSARRTEEDGVQGLQATRPQKPPCPGTRACIDAPAIPASKPVTVTRSTEWELLMQLDSWSRPGLSVAEFKRLFKSSDPSECCICARVCDCVCACGVDEVKSTNSEGGSEMAGMSSTEAFSGAMSGGDCSIGVTCEDEGAGVERLTFALGW
ncbi:hypothetical protein BJ138DRAFT_1099479 [Hygrophoropsis aurantiaca]|uniref:Uncharacterized protein n=1 Tax=Hygrophoropsis aurantiaca TaxID=72124 RepID=A0ACB8AJ59_9AGAM|nr:hypothetical protein BJ138DRAFT_1099479 [Hygrophoropsis aurantiaca]